MSRPVDWHLLGRYALLVALTDLVPIPLVDTGIENYLRRRMVRSLAARHGVALDDEAVRVLGNAASGGCLGCLGAVVMWPIKKVLKTIVFAFQVKGIADTASEVLHRGLMLEEAFEMGLLPAEPARVRAAMDRSLAAVDTRLVERNVMGTFRDKTHELNAVVQEATRVARGQVEVARQLEALGSTEERLAAAAEERLAAAAEADAVGAETREMSAAMAASVQGTGLVPELLHWFRAELGASPDSPIAVGGVLEPEVLPPDEPVADAAPAAEVADAEEVR